VWLWGKLCLRGKSRSASGLGERLGYMRGSFARLVDALELRLDDLGATLHLKDAVKRIDRTDDGFELHTSGSTWTASRVVVAAPVFDYLEVAGHLLPDHYRARLAGLRATGAMCTILELDHSLTPYYWLNIADPNLPFGGLIEHTNYIPRKRYGGRHILYISNYLFREHPMFMAPKKRVLESYLPALATINPSFEPSWIVKSHHFRAEYAQPVVTVGYRDCIPSRRAPVPGLYLCTMAKIFPEDRGQNYAIAHGEMVARDVLDDLRYEKIFIPDSKKKSAAQPSNDV
jgi:protoporphyrinogen oxidase